jgi:negative regulator of sigma E activity
MKQKISELMDGELGQAECPAPLAALREEGEARDAWRMYHLISDSLQETRLLSAGFAQRVAARIAEEATVVAPGREPVRTAQRQWFALSAAASMAAVALVAWLAFAPQQTPAPAAPLAQAPQAPSPTAVQPVATAQEPAQVPPPAGATAQEPAQVPPPAGATDYLLAHQGYSPRNSLLGVAPYVRSVSSEAAPRRP